MQLIHSVPASALGPSDQRGGDRFGIAVPVTLDAGGVEGETLDLSETGILFETSAQAQLAPGATVGLTLYHSLDGREYQTRYEVEVVRVELVGSKLNVAGRFLGPLVSGQ